MVIFLVIGIIVMLGWLVTYYVIYDRGNFRLLKR